MTNSIIVGRTRARSQAIQVLFQAEIQGVDVFDLLEGGEYALDDGPIAEYAAQIARGVAVNRIAIDRIMGAVSHNWNLSRMPLVDRCVMAIAIYEMFCQEDIPTSVAISEAVELSKVYGTDDSSSFVNGILGRVATLADANPDLPLARLALVAIEEGGKEGAETVEQPAEATEDAEDEGGAPAEEPGAVPSETGEAGDAALACEPETADAEA